MEDQQSTATVQEEPDSDDDTRGDSGATMNFFIKKPQFITLRKGFNDILDQGNDSRKASVLLGYPRTGYNMQYSGFLTRYSSALEKHVMCQLVVTP